jgi:hypothetical protein
VAVQDTLGEHQDAQVAMERIRDMVDEGDLPVRAVFLLGRISERYARRAEDLRGGFPDVYAGIRGRPWRDLRDALDERREDALATMPPRRVPRLRTALPPPATPEPVEAPAGLSVVRD